jgi:hypothetical protein
MTEYRHPLHYETIRAHQQADEALLHAAQQAPQSFQMKQFRDAELLCFVPRGQPQAWKIALPDNMLAPLIQWYHQSLSHVGMTRLGQTIGRHFYNPKPFFEGDFTPSPCTR